MRNKQNQGKIQKFKDKLRKKGSPKSYKTCLKTKKTKIWKGLGTWGGLGIWPYGFNMFILTAFGLFSEWVFYRTSFKSPLVKPINPLFETWISVSKLLEPAVGRKFRVESKFEDQLFLC